MGTQVIQTSEATVSMVELLREKAKAAQKQRQKAPLAAVGLEVRIAPKEIIKRFSAEQGGNNAPEGMHYLFVPEKDMKAYALRGYEVQMEDGDLVRNGADVLVACPTWMYDDELAANKIKSDRMTAKRIHDYRAEAKRSKVVAQDQEQVTIAEVGPERRKVGRPRKSDE